MTSSNIVAILANHGCEDLTASLNESACSRYPIANGGLGDVYRGRLLDGTSVAVKTIRSYYDQGQLARVYHKRAAREIYTWSKCKHSNVALLMGVAVFRDCLAMISAWEENGSLLRYLLRHPSADRCQLSTSICSGLVYLHDNNIVHGDLKGDNVLIAQDGRPTLIDFGNATLKDATLQFTQTSTGLNMSFRWTAPEILDGKSPHTIAGDIYSLGMTILETFTSAIPFAGRTEQSLYGHVVFLKNTPTRPEEIIPQKSLHGDTLWTILTNCWSYDPKARPSARAVWEDMKPITPDTLKEIDDRERDEDRGQGEE
ncbi:kinase-like domain-containing protein [Rhizoctonia solani]|nr:kinase-like domain-containing protein [Rhizoctonia solani]